MRSIDSFFIYLKLINIYLFITNGTVVVLPGMG